MQLGSSSMPPSSSRIAARSSGVLTGGMAALSTCTPSSRARRMLCESAARGLAPGGAGKAVVPSLIRVPSRFEVHFPPMGRRKPQHLPRAPAADNALVWIVASEAVRNALALREVAGQQLARRLPLVRVYRRDIEGVVALPLVLQRQ